MSICNLQCTDKCVSHHSGYMRPEYHDLCKKRKKKGGNKQSKWEAGKFISAHVAVMVTVHHRFFKKQLLIWKDVSFCYNFINLTVINHCKKCK